jgi:hypothetical protein
MKKDIDAGKLDKLLSKVDDEIGRGNLLDLH